MNIYNNWRVAEDTVHPFIQALQDKKILFMEFKKEDGLPCIEVAVHGILSPAKALEFGYLMEQASGKSIYFHSLGSESVNFIVNDPIMFGNKAVDINEYGYPLLEVAQVWAK